MSGAVSSRSLYVDEIFSPAPSRDTVRVLHRIKQLAREQGALKIETDAVNPDIGKLLARLGAKRTGLGSEGPPGQHAGDDVGHYSIRVSALKSEPVVKAGDVVAVDFDGTMTVSEDMRASESMRRLVLELLDSGVEVVVFSARASDAAGRELIEGWLGANGYPDLEVTGVKSPDFRVMLDDRAIEVTPEILEDPGLAERVASFASWFEKSVLAEKAAWDESKHPRDPEGEGGGQFTSGAGGAGFPKTPRTTASERSIARRAKPVSRGVARQLAMYVSPEYGNFNDSLRSAKPDARASAVARAFASAEHPLPEGTVLYRGVGATLANVEELEAGDPLKKLLGEMRPGRVVTMRGLTSTAYDPEQVSGEKWAGKKGIIFMIKAKRGVLLGEHLNKHMPEVDDDEPASEDNMSFGGEQEVVLKHNSKFRVIAMIKAMKFGKSTHPVVQLEQL